MGSCEYTFVYIDNDVLDDFSVEYTSLTITGSHCLVLARLTFLGYCVFDTLLCLCRFDVINCQVA